MTIVACGCTGHVCRCAQPAPLVMDSAELASLETVPAGPDGPGGSARMAVLVFPGVRLSVDPASTDVDAARWWHEVGVSALLAAMYYDEGECGSRSAR